MEKRIVIDGADFRKLLKWMNIPQKINQTDYEEWKKDRKARIPYPREDLYLRGADFSGYWKCPRKLWLHIHEPKQQKSMINKSIFSCELRHDRIEDYLARRGWKPEFLAKKKLTIGRFKNIPCRGHIDSLSPSNIILDIKHKFRPADGDLIQTGFYQKLMRPTTTNILLLYPSQIKYLMSLDKMMDKYLPRVLACVALDIMPPVHPDFPNCFYNCEYYKRCGRSRIPPKKESKSIWNEWVFAINQEIQPKSL